MCKFCDKYNFGNVGYDFDSPSIGENPHIYFPSHTGGQPEEERFKFCPVCGTELTPNHFKDPSQRTHLVDGLIQDRVYRVTSGDNGTLREGDLFFIDSRDGGLVCGSWGQLNADEIYDSVFKGVQFVLDNAFYVEHGPYTTRISHVDTTALRRSTSSD